MASPEDVRKLLDKNGPELLACIQIDEIFIATLVKLDVISSHQSRELQNQTWMEKITFILNQVRSNLKIAGLRSALEETKQERALSLLDTGEDPESQRKRTQSSPDEQPKKKMKTKLELESTHGMKNLKEYYKSCFKASTYLCTSWQCMDKEESYVQTDLRFREQKANAVGTDLKIDENKLFNGKSMTIVMEGNPGSGKTMLMERYAWQWAEQKAEQFINNLALLIVCQGSSIRPTEGIEASIEAFLSRFDQEGYLYEYYTLNKESCLVIFEAMDEAPEEARQLVVQYVKARPARQPIIITGRTDCFKKTPIKVDLLVDRTGFSKDQAIRYFKDRFKDVVIDVENLIDAGAISADFLESPYNCYNLGLLLTERMKKGGRSLNDKVEFSSTLLLKSIFLEKLKKLNMKVGKAPFKNLSNFALWGTMKDKHRFSEEDLEEFDLANETILSGLFCRHVYMSEDFYTFPHKTEKDYLAAWAITKLEDDDGRDAFYRILASDRKYAAVLRFVSGLLDEERVQEGKDFQMMFAHAKLLGGIKHHESTHKENVLNYSKTLVKSVLSTFLDKRVARDSQIEKPEPEFMSHYRAECDNFISAKFRKDERQAFLDGDNGRVCISKDMLDIFKDFYLRLKELSVPNKEAYDMIKTIIGDGMTRNDPVHGKMDVFPIGKHGRWGQILVRPDNCVWIVVHSVDDAIVAFKRLPCDLKPPEIYFCVPADLARKVWGIPELENLKPLFQMIPQKDLTKLAIWMASPCQLINALPPGLENIEIWVCPCSNHEEELWSRFFQYMFSKPMYRLAICHIYSGSDLARDGCLQALRHSPWSTARFQEFRMLDGNIKFEDVLSFDKEVLQNLEYITFKFDRTVISEVGSIEELGRLMDGNIFIAVAIKPSKNIEYREDECNQVIASKWGSTEPTADTTKLYLKTLDATTRLDHVDYELPQCREKETVENVNNIVDRVVNHFKTLPSKHPFVRIHMRVWKASVKDHISEKDKVSGISIGWSKDQHRADLAALNLQIELDQND